MYQYKHIICLVALLLLPALVHAQDLNAIDAGGELGTERMMIASTEEGTSPVESGDPSTDSSGCIDSNNIRRTCIPLIQPLGGPNRVFIGPGVQTFVDYFTQSAPLLMTVSVGFAVLWILIGSYYIMISGSDGGKRSEGKTIITWAMIGLILINFAGFFLRTLNNIFFT